MAGFCHLLDLTDDELASRDPVELNLLVALSIPALAGLDISKYQRQADEWAAAIRKRLRAVEHVFHQTPADWDHDIRLFRLGVMAEYLDCELGVRYIEEHRELKTVRYTDPSHLFLNGVMDTRRGTCGSLATLHVAISRRLGWPASLAAAKSHLVCRYDDGQVTHNIEATQTGLGGFGNPTDEWLSRTHDLPQIAVTSGSDLRAITVREMLGMFVGFRGRHMRDTGRIGEAERDYLLARGLFPTNRRLFVDAQTLTLDRGETLFDPWEEQFARPAHPPPHLREKVEAARRSALQSAVVPGGMVYSVPLTTGTTVISTSLPRREDS